MASQAPTAGGNKGPVPGEVFVRIDANGKEVKEPAAQHPPPAQPAAAAKPPPVAQTAAPVQKPGAPLKEDATQYGNLSQKPGAPPAAPLKEDATQYGNLSQKGGAPPPAALKVDATQHGNLSQQPGLPPGAPEKEEATQYGNLASEGGAPPPVAGKEDATQYGNLAPDGGAQPDIQTDGDAPPGAAASEAPQSVFLGQGPEARNTPSGLAAQSCILGQPGAGQSVFLGQGHNAAAAAAQNNGPNAPPGGLFGQSYALGAPAGGPGGMGVSVFLSQGTAGAGSFASAGGGACPSGNFGQSYALGQACPGTMGQSVFLYQQAKKDDAAKPGAAAAPGAAKPEEKGEHLMIDPKELKFVPPFNKPQVQNLKLANKSKNIVVYKVMASVPQYYHIRGQQGVLKTNQASAAVVRLNALDKPAEAKKETHTILVQTAIVDKAPTDTSQFWKAVDAVKNKVQFAYVKVRL